MLETFEKIPMEIELPKSMLSWSQASKWHKTATHRDYIRQYFFNDKEIFENDYMIFGKYISDVLESQDAIELPDVILHVIEQLDTLGNPETKLEIDYGNFSVVGYADDANSDCSKIREWKTGKLWTQEKVDQHGQLDTYASAVYKEKGYIPEIILTSMEVAAVDEPCVILDSNQKSPNVCFTGVVKHFERVVTIEDIERIDEFYRETAEEISKWWKVFQKCANL